MEEGIAEQGREGVWLIRLMGAAVILATMFPAFFALSSIDREDWYVATVFSFMSIIWFLAGVTLMQCEFPAAGG